MDEMDEREINCPACGQTYYYRGSEPKNIQTGSLRCRHLPLVIKAITTQEKKNEEYNKDYIIALKGLDKEFP